jgi:hypothetical protein
MIKFRWFPAQPLPKYPHLGPYESVLWDTYLKSRPIPFTRCAYDVCLKVPYIYGLSFPESVKKDWEYLTAFKIDCVCDTVDSWILVEIKSFLSPAAIGQLLMYKALFEVEMLPKKRIDLWLVCRKADNILLDSFQKYGITTIII